MLCPGYHTMTQFLLFVCVLLCATATSLSTSNHVKSTSSVPNESRNYYSKPKNPFFITQRMRRVLEDDLLYTTEEVDSMDYSIAVTIIQKGLARPRQGMPKSWKKQRVWPLINEKARAKWKARFQKIGDRMKSALHTIGEQLNHGITRIEDTWEDHCAPIADQLRQKLSAFQSRLHNRWISLKTTLTAPATFAVTHILPKILVGSLSWLLLPRIIDAIGFCTSVIIGALQMTASLPTRVLPLLTLPKREKVLISTTSKPPEDAPKKKTSSQPSSPIATSRKMTVDMIKRLSASAAEKVTAVSKLEDTRKQREADKAAAALKLEDTRKLREAKDADNVTAVSKLEDARKQREAKDAEKAAAVSKLEDARKQREAKDAEKAAAAALKLEDTRKQRETKDAEKAVAALKLEDARKQREAMDAARKQQESVEAARKQQREASEIARKQQEAKDIARRQQEAIETLRKQKESEKIAYEQQREADETARRRLQEAEERKQRREAEEIVRKQQRAEEEKCHKQRVSELAAKMKAAKTSAAALENAQREAKSKQVSQSKFSVKQVDKKVLVSTGSSKVPTSTKPDSTQQALPAKNNIKRKLEVTSVVKKKLDKKKVDLEMLSKVLR